MIEQKCQKWQKSSMIILINIKKSYIIVLNKNAKNGKKVQ